MNNGLTVIVASVDPMKTLQYWRTWREQAAEDFRLVMVLGGIGLEELSEEVNAQLKDGDAVVQRALDGVIPAYFAGIKEAWGEGDPGIIACFHDDLAILERGWDERIREVFTDQSVVLAGFGGGTGLGASDIYVAPYSPHQLARQDFVSNMKDAEIHGRRGTEAEKVACLDGFSQIGRADFIYEAYKAAKDLNIKHHAYDSLYGAWARKAGYTAIMIPILVHHAGGTTAIGSEKYQEWARSVNENGDQGFWEESHRIMYEECKGILPFSVKE